MATLKCKRAVYGRVPFPMEQREYVIIGNGSAVGCIGELISYAKITAFADGYDKIELQDLDGTYLVDVATGKVTKKKEEKIVQYCGWCGAYLGDYKDWKSCLCPECEKSLDDKYDGDMDEMKRQRAIDRAEEMALEEARERDYEKKAKELSK